MTNKVQLKAQKRRNLTDKSNIMTEKDTKTNLKKDIAWAAFLVASFTLYSFFNFDIGI